MLNNSKIEIKKEEVETLECLTPPNAKTNSALFILSNFTFNFYIN